MYAALLLMFAPVTAEQPRQTEYTVVVSVIVINRVRSYTEITDDWGRKTWKPHEVWWISFWLKPYSVFPGAWYPGKLCWWIDRGWWSAGNVSMSRCSDGWMMRDGNGLNIVAPEVWVIDSTFDVELTWRNSAYKPIRKQ